MDKITLIGDVHGKYDKYIKICNKIENPTIQVGDMGVGFIGSKIPNNWDKKDTFFNGNHDDPTKCLGIGNYLGKYGLKNNVFFIGGGYSIDYMNRTPEVAWWRDEEIKETDYELIWSLVERHQPEIIASHDCPREIIQFIYNEQKDRYYNRTCDILLQGVLDRYKPKFWVFGHHHIDNIIYHKGVVFVSLGELSYITLTMGEK